MLRINKQGFTLIELMVVIVIIGVLASLAIPRFTEASLKAKVAEAPRVLASFESAYFAAIAEKGEGTLSSADLIYSPPDANWFAYSTKDEAASGVVNATAQGKLGTKNSGNLSTTFNGTADPECFTHGGTQKLLDLVPNFRDGGCKSS